MKGEVHEENSRVVQEYLNESQRETPFEVVTPENRADYDVEMISMERENNSLFSQEINFGIILFIKEE